MLFIKILIDGDSCNRIKTIEKMVRNKKIPVLIFCDWTRNIVSDYAEIHIVEKGKDSVDFSLLKYVEAGDIVVTQDTGLASIVLAKKAYAIHNNGIQFTDENINYFLNRRYIRMKVTRDSKRKQCKGLKIHSKQPTLSFGEAFHKLLSYVIKQNKNKEKEI